MARYDAVSAHCAIDRDHSGFSSPGGGLYRNAHLSQYFPFANLSEDQSQDYFADGITDDLITDLARLSNLDVISQNSVFAYKGKPHVLDEIRRDPAFASSLRAAYSASAI